MAVQRHIPAALSDYAIKLAQEPDVYTGAPVLAPTKSVSKKTDQYFIYDPSQSFQQGDTLRPNKVAARRIDFQALSTGTYVLKNHSLAMPISKEDVETADASVNPELDAMDELMGQILLDKEVEAAKAFFTTSAISNNTTLTTSKWSYDTSTSNPIDDIDTAISTITKSIGRVPNNALINFTTWQTLKDHSELLDRIKWSEKGVLGEDLVASLLGIEKLTVNKVIAQSNAFGISATTDFLFGSHCLVFYNQTNPGLRNANLGTCFTGIYGDVKPEVRKYRDENIDADIIEANWSYDTKVVLSISGYLIASVV